MKGYQIQEAFCSKLRLQIISNLVSKKTAFHRIKKINECIRWQFECTAEEIRRLGVY